MSTHTKHKRKSHNMDSSDRSDSDLAPQARNRVDRGRNYRDKPRRDWSNKQESHGPHFNLSSGRKYENRNMPFTDGNSSFVKVTGPPPNRPAHARGHRQYRNQNDSARSFYNNNSQFKQAQDLNHRRSDNMSESFEKACSISDSGFSGQNDQRDSFSASDNRTEKYYDNYSDTNEDWDSDNSSELIQRCFELSQSPPDPHRPTLDSVLHSLMHEKSDDHCDEFTASLQDPQNHQSQSAYDYDSLIGSEAVTIRRNEQHRSDISIFSSCRHLYARNVISARTNQGHKKLRTSTESSGEKRIDRRIVVNKEVYTRNVILKSTGDDDSSDDDSYTPRRNAVRSVIVKQTDSDEMPPLEDARDSIRSPSSKKKISSIQKLRLQELRKMHAERKKAEPTPLKSRSSDSEDSFSPGRSNKFKGQKVNRTPLYLPPHLRGNGDDSDDNTSTNSSGKYSSKKSKRNTEIESIKNQLAVVDEKIKLNADSDILHIREKSKKETNTSSDSEMLRQRSKAQTKSESVAEEEEILRLRRSKSGTKAKKDSSVSKDEEYLKLRRKTSNSSLTEEDAVTSNDSDILRIRRNASNPDLVKEGGSKKSWADIVDEEEFIKKRENSSVPTHRTKGGGRGVSSVYRIPELEEDNGKKTRKYPQSEPRKRMFNFSADSSPSDKSIKKRLSLGETTSSTERSESSRSRYEMYKEESGEKKPSFQQAANSWRKEKRNRNNAWGRKSSAGKDHTDASLSYQERLDALRNKCSHMYSKPGGANNISWKTGNWKAKFQERFSKLPNIPYIDTHCHIDFLFGRTGYQGSFAEYLDENSETVPATFGGCVAVFCNPSSYFSESKLFLELMKEPNIHGAVGVHPKSACDFNPRVEKQMRWMLSHKKVKALGEIGLDYSGTFYQKAAVQKRVFVKQLKMAEELDMPLVIHCRDAEEDCVAIMEQTIDRNHLIHRHCWTGNWEDCEIWMDKFPNSYIGLTPLVTQNSGRAMPVREVAARLPLDKLLLETDAPYFVPSMIPRDYMPFTHPALAVTVATEVAELQDVPVADVLEAVMENTLKMYGVEPVF